MEINPPLPLSTQKSLNKTHWTLIIIAVAAGILVGRYLIPAGVNVPPELQYVTVTDNQEERQLVFPTFWEAWDALQSKYIGIDEVPEEDLYYGAVAGMVDAADDPYTVFSTPADTKQFEQTIEGSFSGIGVEIGIRNGAVTVIAPLDGSPAEHAGILQGDIVVGVDDMVITPDMTLDDVVQKIRGRKGTEVKLTVVHEGAGETDEVTITRDTIKIESIKLNIENGIAHLRIVSFNGDTSEQFTSAAREISKDPTIKGIILDVRNNPGGFLQTAVDIASRFLPSKTLVVTERGENGKEYLASGNTILEGIPTVTLVNGGSASASEILAGALHDEAGVPIVGEQTFGKGSVQELVKLTDGSSIRVTVAKWFTPAGRNIDEEGIAPTIEVEADRETEEDEQLEKAREEIQKVIESSDAQ